MKTGQKDNGGHDRASGLWTESELVRPPMSISDQIYDLLLGIADHFLPRDIREGISAPCKQQTHKIIVFSDRPDG